MRNHGQHTCTHDHTHEHKLPKNRNKRAPPCAITPTTISMERTHQNQNAGNKHRPNAQPLQTGPSLNCTFIITTNQAKLTTETDPKHRQLHPNRTINTSETHVHNYQRYAPRKRATIIVCAHHGRENANRSTHARTIPANARVPTTTCANSPRKTTTHASFPLPSHQQPQICAKHIKPQTIRTNTNPSQKHKHAQNVTVYLSQTRPTQQQKNTEDARNPSTKT